MHNSQDRESERRGRCHGHRAVSEGPLLGHMTGCQTHTYNTVGHMTGQLLTKELPEEIQSVMSHTK